jgi:CheY-like chemotaxis protein
MELKQKVLVVDVEPSIRKYLQTLLEVEGFDVEAVSDGKEALAKINNGDRPDFIILDLFTSGLETLLELMGLEPQCHCDRFLELGGCASFPIRSAGLPRHPVRENGTR